MDNFKDVILKWNTQYPYDYIWRKKYNIPYNSSKHRDVNQVDIYFDLQEDVIMKKYQQDIVEERNRRKEYEKTGVWFEVEDNEESRDIASRKLMERLKAKENSNGGQ